MNNLKYRMYGLVNYQLSGTIHAGIQFGHAVVEYQLKYGHTEAYKQWSMYDKTFIVLNGGTTNLGNNNSGYIGTLNKYLETLHSENIITAEFYEEDLGNQLTAVVFLVDERVFDRESYPDFNFDDLNAISTFDGTEVYDDWVKVVGGKENVFLRSFLPKFKLA